MDINISTPGELSELVTALGGTMPDELNAIADTIKQVRNWHGPDTFDISVAARTGALTSDTAVDLLDQAVRQPTIEPTTVRAQAVHGLLQRYSILVAGSAGDSIIESVRPAFTEASAAIAEAANLVLPNATAADLSEADDDYIAAWRALGEHRGTLDKVGALIELLAVTGFNVLGGLQPWHTPRAREAAFFAGETRRLLDVGRALTLPNGSGGPRGGKWHQISSALVLNTVTEARLILAEAQREREETQAKERATIYS